MYQFQITVKGQSLEELKKAVVDVHNELNSGVLRSGSITKILEEVSEENSHPGEHFLQPIINKTNEIIQNHNDVPTIEQGTPAFPGANIQAGEVAARVAERDVQNHNDVPTIEQGVPIHDTSNLQIELDAEGIPWDKRIHTSTKTQMKREKTWKRKRDLEDSFVTQVKNELLLNVQQAANPAVIPPAPINADTPIIEQPLAPVLEQPVVELPPAVAPIVNQLCTPPVAVVEAPISPVVEQPVVVDAPIVAPAPTPQLSGSGHTIETFSAGFPMILANLITEGKVTQDYVNELKTYFNAKEIWELTPEQKTEVFNSFVGFGFIQKVG